jgi:hypothetical protein
MKDKTAKRLSRAGNPAGRFIPKGSEGDSLAVHRELADLNRERRNRARAQGRPYVALLGAEHVYRDPGTGQLVPASKASQRAFVDGWELAGYRARRNECRDRAARSGEPWPHGVKSAVEIARAPAQH